MLIIRQEQFRALTGAFDEEFERAMVQYLRRQFPRECLDRSDDDLQSFVRRAKERAARYDIELHEDICRFANLMMVLGPEFDTDPGIGWARQILSSWRPGGPSARIQHLYQTAISRLANV
jgi:hypothetical protein